MEGVSCWAHRSSGLLSLQACRPAPAGYWQGDVKQAARGVLIFRPRIVYPYHYRGQGGTRSDLEMFRALIGDDQPIEVRLRDWYAE